LPIEPYRQQLAAELRRRISDISVAREIARVAGVPVGPATAGTGIDLLWQAIVDKAVSINRVPRLLDVAGSHLTSGNGDNITDANVNDPASVAGWSHVGPEELEGYERRIGSRSTLLPVSFLARGLQAARSVCLIRYTVENPNTGLQEPATATGFLIAADRLLTCFHVLPDAGVAETAFARFGFEQRHAGTDYAGEEFKILPTGGFWTSGNRDHDWTVVAIDRAASERYGFLTISKVDFAGMANVNIIGHPDGDAKQIALYDNLLVGHEKNRVLYTTETSLGSSGSPVFDSDWRVVALHNGWRMKAQRLGLRTVYRNAGVNINRVVDDLAQHRI
jgi:V8-like Glu-specific endopeptidase